MKIAFTSDYFYPHTGGAEQSLMELARSLVKKGHDVTVYTRGEGRESEINGIKVKRIFHTLDRWTFKNEVLFPKYVDRKEAKRFLTQIRKEGYDVIHSNNRDTAVFTAMAGKKAGVPSVTHIRDYWPICPKRDLHRLEGICKEPNKCWSCMSKYYGDWLKTPFYWKSQRDTKYRHDSVKRYSELFIYNSRYVRDKVGLKPGTVIYNPVDIEVTQKQRIPGKVLFIGNVTKRKGIIELSRAMKYDDMGEMELHIVGDGYLSPAIKGSNIIKHGRLEYEDVKKHLADAEMLIVPSLWPEPFGRVAVEGMAAGVPVISSSYGGLKEAVGEAGILLNEVTEKGLKQAILKLHEDPELRDELSEKGMERSKMFSPERIADQVLSIYKKVI